LVCPLPSRKDPISDRTISKRGYLPPHPPFPITNLNLQTLRVISVLDGVLASREYLVGDKPTIADLVFFPWDFALPFVFGGTEREAEVKNFKNLTRWHESIKLHPAVAKCWALREKIVSNTE
jgi:glutathione S-transferase